ncbi:DUF402 domain-containing protein [Paenibacillus sp. NPDC058071]|uniref:DUF402 domain-containing protein n=1 Tax=Paenibacillus sp. NPDC058071 TaxID=3346326 RepID=UPI0036DD897C
MANYQHCMIKSFKHDGRLHRTWQRNWRIPDEWLAPRHREEEMIVLINRQTPILESDGKLWVSKVPAVSFFIPGQWFNVVALLEQTGIRYYCNVASPPYVHDNVLTYIDYDLDVIRTADGMRHVVDQDEYDLHRIAYHYPKMVEDKVQQGLSALLSRMDRGQEPFEEKHIRSYYDSWYEQFGNCDSESESE